MDEVREVKQWERPVLNADWPKDFEWQSPKNDTVALLCVRVVCGYAKVAQESLP